MKIHFIAIGGSIMHSLAIALQDAGHTVSGSDDGIFDPARSKLEAAGLLPAEMGWMPDRIDADTDAVILGMHAFDDNPELQKARALEIPLYSFPAYIYEHARQKQRIVIAGSYGKTSVTAMVMHVLGKLNRKFDYLVGGQVPGFEQAVRLSQDAPIILLEGDEYLSSKLDPRPKFLSYKPHLLSVSGISWDHMNVFPTESGYIDQFRKLIQTLAKAAQVVYNESDKVLKQLIENETDTELHYLHGFKAPSYKVRDGVFQVKIAGEYQKVSVFGAHNMTNLANAWEICQLLRVTASQFRESIADFVGAGLRMEQISGVGEPLVIRDYAHAPIKVRATVEGLRQRFPKRRIIACVELHTFSSLNKEFLPQYKDALKAADRKIVLVDPKALEKRRMPALEASDIQEAFADTKLSFVENAVELEAELSADYGSEDVLLLMSSGNFCGWSRAQK